MNVKRDLDVLRGRKFALNIKDERNIKIFMLRLFSGLTFKEIAERFGITPSLVRQIVIKQYQAYICAYNVWDLYDEENKRLLGLVDEQAKRQVRALEALDKEFSALPFSRRVLNCFENNNINCLEDLLRCSESDLLRKPNFGRKSLKEVKSILSRYGLYVGHLRHERDRQYA